MLNYFLAFTVSFVSVFFKAFQNRNYNFNNYRLVVPTSWAIAACELYLLSLFIKEGITLWYVLIVGTGSGLGGMLAKWFHKRVTGG